MKSKLTLTLIILITICVSSFAQVSTLITNFKPAYSNGDVRGFISDAENSVSNLKDASIIQLFI